jgi:hypothetical protein
VYMWAQWAVILWSQLRAMPQPCWSVSLGVLALPVWSTTTKSARCLWNLTATARARSNGLVLAALHWHTHVHGDEALTGDQAPII